MRSRTGRYDYKNRLVGAIACATAFFSGCNMSALADQGTFMGVAQSFQGATLQPSLIKIVEWTIIAIALTVFGFWRYRVNKHKREMGITDEDDYDYLPEPIKRPSVVSGGQNRSFARLNTRIEIAYCLYDRVESPLRKDIHKGIVTNLSGGGLLLATNDTLKPESKLMLIFYFKPDTATYLMAKVIRLINHEEDDGYQYKAALEFEGIREGHRDSVIKWIFEQERENIKSMPLDGDDEEE